MYTYKLFFLCCVTLVSVFGAPKKSIQWKPCRQSDPKFNDCLQSQIQTAIPQLSDGYPKFRIPPIDPFDLSQLSIAKGQGSVAVDLSLQNIKIYGLSTAIIENLKVNVEHLAASAKLRFTTPLHMIGQYTAKGKVQVFPINGKGACNITFVDPVLELTDLKGEKVVRNGQTFVDLKGITLKVVSLKKAVLRLDNLIQGNKELSDNLNVFLNENWQLLTEELKPAFEEAIQIIVKGIVNQSLQKIAIDDLFPK